MWQVVNVFKWNGTRRRWRRAEEHLTSARAAAPQPWCRWGSAGSCWLWGRWAAGSPDTFPTEGSSRRRRWPAGGDTDRSVRVNVILTSDWSWAGGHLQSEAIEDLSCSAELGRLKIDVSSREQQPEEETLRWDVWGGEQGHTMRTSIFSTCWIICFMIYLCIPLAYLLIFECIYYSD